MALNRMVWIVGGALVLLVGASVWWTGAKDGPDKPVSAPVTAPAKVSERPPSGPAPGTAGGPGNDVEPTPEQKEARAKKKAAALEAIEDASTTYDAAELPVINPYLYDPDPEIRKAAMDGMIVLGDAAAGKLLREAAESASSPEEARAMRQAADYVELPPMDPKEFAEMARLRKEQAQANPQRPGMGRRPNAGFSSQPKPKTPAPAPAPAPVAPAGQ